MKGKENNNVSNIISFENNKITKGEKKYSGGNPYQPYDLAIKMQFVKGDTLCKYIKQRKENGNKYKISELYNLIYRICSVLREFREEGLIYSDIKEENIMIDKDGGFTIIDVDSATTPKVTRKNSTEGATNGEKENMDLIALIKMALRIVRGSKNKSQKYQFDLLDFENNDIGIIFR